MKLDKIAISKNASLDLQTIIKLLQSLSSKVRLRDIIEELMRLKIENTGVKRGVLILNDNEEWFIEAELSTKKRIY